MTRPTLVHSEFSHLVILEGECEGEIRDGVGIYTYSNGDKYEGQWKNNMKEGKGYFYYNNGELYMGEWYITFSQEFIFKVKE